MTHEHAKDLCTSELSPLMIQGLKYVKQKADSLQYILFVVIIHYQQNERLKM